MLGGEGMGGAGQGAGKGSPSNLPVQKLSRSTSMAPTQSLGLAKQRWSSEGSENILLKPLHHDKLNGWQA